MIEPGDPYGFDWSFVALESRARILQRVYRIYVGDRLLCGAVVRAPVLVPYWPRSAAWEDPEHWVYLPRMARYDGVNVTSPYFLRRARGNFHLSRARLIGAELAPANGAAAGIPQSGRLRLRFARGRTRDFLLLGIQDAAAIRDRLRPAPAPA